MPEATSLSRRFVPFMRVLHLLRENAVVVAFVVFTLSAALRYDGFLGQHNVSEFLRYNARFGFIALGMTFVIVTGGIDLSVGSVVAMASVLTAHFSPCGLLPALVVPVLAGCLVGTLKRNGGGIRWRSTLYCYFGVHDGCAGSGFDLGE